MAISKIPKDKIAIDTLQRVSFFVNENGTPIFRWIVNDNLIHQFNLTTGGITYYKYENGNWTTVWSNH